MSPDKLPENKLRSASHSRKNSFIEGITTTPVKGARIDDDALEKQQREVESLIEESKKTLAVAGVDHESKSSEDGNQGNDEDDDESEDGQNRNGRGSG